MTDPGRHDLVRREAVLDHRYLRLSLDTVRDSTGREFTYVHGTGPDIVYVVPVHADGTVTLLRQVRYAMEGRSLEVPGGHVDEGEEPAAAAARELREETGLVAGRLTHLLTFLLSVKVQQQLHVFVAEDLVEGAHDRDVDEDIEVLRVPLSDCVRRAVAGEVRHGPSIVAIHTAHARIAGTG